MHLRGLYRASFGERMPIVEGRGGVVSIHYTRVASCDWTGNRPERPAEVALNAGIPRGTSRCVPAHRGFSSTCAGYVSER